jgi:Predicted integral membrane protein
MKGAIVMWDRGILKSNAKIALGGRYWTAFGVSLLAAAIIEGFSWSTRRFTVSFDNLPWNEGIASVMAIVLSLSAILIALIGFLYYVFVALPVTIGESRYYVHNHFGASDFGTLFSSFRYGYVNSAAAMLVTEIFIGLWYLLLIIPGIIKQLEYSMVKYLLADNPNLTGSRARELSRILTNGEKGAIFVLGLSFIGWYLLGAICFGVGILFVNPYYQATMAELYIFLRDRAIQTHQIDPAELGLVPPTGPYYNPENPPIL